MKGLRTIAERSAGLQTRSGHEVSHALRLWRAALRFSPLRGRGGPPRSRRACRAFTMVEIAIALAVIGFALVAIIGILPAGMQVQKDNREDTIIGQDALYFLEAIRTGAQGLDELTNYVDQILINGESYKYGSGPATLPSGFTNGHNIIGLMSTPGVVVTNIVRALSGAVAEQGVGTRDIAFKYQMTTENNNFKNYDPELPDRTNVTVLLHELRLEFRWPVLPKGGTGSGRQVFRALVNGTITNMPAQPSFYFFQP